MRNSYVISCLKMQGKKSKVAFITFTIMLFTVAFSQAQQAFPSNRSGKVLMAQEQVHQTFNSQILQPNNDQITDFPSNGISISKVSGSARKSTSATRLGNTNITSSATGACGKGAVGTTIDAIYGNFNTYSFADDFVVAPHEIFYLSEIEFIFLLDYNVTSNEMFLDFYDNAIGGGPGSALYIPLDNIEVEEENLGEYGTTIKDIMLITVTFPTPIAFHGGMEGASFWAASRITHNGGPNSAATVGTSTMSASQTFYVNPGTSWIKSTDAYTSVPPQDLIVGFYGQCQDVPVFVWQNGSWTPQDPSGIATASDNILVVNGTTSLTANTNVNNLLIKQAATLNINKVLNLHGDLNIKGDLVFVSNATGNGELGQVSATSTILGNATVQRYMQNKHSYRMVSSAVTSSTSIHNNWQESANSNTHNPKPGYGTHITGATVDQQNGFDGTAAGNPSMFTMNLTSQEFVAIGNTNVNKLNVGNPYLLYVRGDRSVNLTNAESSSATVLRAKGALHTAYQTQNFPGLSAGKFAMFGNPFQSAVNVNTLLENAVNVNKGHYYVYDPTLGSHGAYVTVDLDSGANTSLSTANQFLQPGQGAQFVAASNGSAAIVFAETDKAPGNFTATNATDNVLSSNNMLTVQLLTTENFNNNGSVHDSFGIIFDDANTNALTLADAVKPMNFYENFGVNHNGTYLSLERRKMPQADEVYSLYSSGYDHTDYSVKMKIDGLENTSLYLNDHFVGTSTLLISGETVYAFSVDVNNELSIATDRFSIGTEEILSVNTNNLLAGIRLFPNPLNDNIFYVHAPKLNGQQVEVKIADMAGRQVYNNTLDCQDNKIAVSVNKTLNAGVYLVTVKFAGEENTYRLIKQ